jgi:UDP-N-acetylbacillosamine N-acetyltransferase
MLGNGVILVGGFYEIIELCQISGLKIIGVIDSVPPFIQNIELLGSDHDAERIIKKFQNTSLIITPDQPETREKLYNQYVTYNPNFYKLISPKAYISAYSQIGEGCVVQNFVNVSTNVEINRFVKLNTYANIMHDCKVGEFTTIAPNAVVLGKVIIGRSCYIGANSTILPNITIGDNSIIGAGAVVTKNVTKNTTVAGNPAFELKKS